METTLIKRLRAKASEGKVPKPIAALLNEAAQELERRDREVTELGRALEKATKYSRLVKEVLEEMHLPSPSTARRAR